MAMSEFRELSLAYHLPDDVREAMGRVDRWAEIYHGPIEAMSFCLPIAKVSVTTKEREAMVQAAACSLVALAWLDSDEGKKWAELRAREVSDE